MSQDTQLQQTVLAEINWDPSINPGQIGVAASAGVITLSGCVDTYAQKHAAEMAARRVPGVRAVAEEIEVRLPVEVNRSDRAIAAAAVERLAWNVSVPADSVLVQVEAGWVTLTGKVDHQYQRDEAERDVRPMHGVIGVSNQVTIKPRVDTAAIGGDIAHALRRSWFSNPDRIHVRAKGGNIMLTGEVNSNLERESAEQAAWSAPGAVLVENDIAVASDGAAGESL